MDWTIIEQYLKTNTDEALILALLEYDKTLNKELSAGSAETKNFDELLANSKGISNLREVSQARQLLEKVVSVPSFKPAREDLEKAINAYHLALVEYLADEGKPSFYDKLFLLAKQLLFTAKGKNLKKIILLVMGFFVFVYLLAGTSVGKAFGEAVVTGANSAVALLLGALAVFVATLGIAAISLFFFDRVRRGREIKSNNQ